eukprot:scaffold2859_cov349-Pavlova_lutheri.AAC.27
MHLGRMGEGRVEMHPQGVQMHPVGVVGVWTRHGHAMQQIQRWNKTHVELDHPLHTRGWSPPPPPQSWTLTHGCTPHRHRHRGATSKPEHTRGERRPKRAHARGNETKGRNALGNRPSSVESGICIEEEERTNTAEHPKENGEATVQWN